MFCVVLAENKVSAPATPRRPAPPLPLLPSGPDGVHGWPSRGDRRRPKRRVCGVEVARNLHRHRHFAAV